jgi:urease accessory protein
LTKKVFVKGMKRTFSATPFMRRTFFLLPCLFLPSFAQAHPGLPGHVHGFANGLVHPLTGLDHICAMIAVGLWAAQRGGRALWLVPLTFVLAMTAGSALGMAGVSLPFVETGIIASVLILGVLIAASVRLPLAVSGLIVDVFALFHGQAHGLEMPGNASGLAYGAGFILATAGLHLLGISFGWQAQRLGSMRLIRYAGVVITACGACLCLVA